MMDSSSEEHLLHFISVTPVLKQWFFSMPVLKSMSMLNKDLLNEKFEIYMDKDDLKNEDLILNLFDKNLAKKVDPEFLKSVFFVERRIKSHPREYPSLCGSVKNHKRVVFAAVNSNPDIIFPYLSNEWNCHEALLKIILNKITFSQFNKLFSIPPTRQEHNYSAIYSSFNGDIYTTIANSYELVMQVVKFDLEDCKILEIATQRIRNDPTLAAYCLKKIFLQVKPPCRLSSLSQHQRNLSTFAQAFENVLFERNVVMEWLNFEFPHYLENIFGQFANDKEVIMKALPYMNWKILNQISCSMFNDLEIAKCIFELDHSLFPVLSLEIRNDRQVVQKAVGYHAEFFKLASSSLRGDKEFIRECINRKEQSEILKYANLDVILDSTFMKSLPAFIQWDEFPDQCYSDIEFLTYLINKNMLCASLVSVTLSDELLMNLFLDLFPNILTQNKWSRVTKYWKYLPKKLCEKQFFMQYMTNFPQLIIGCKYNDDPDVCSLALEQNNRFIIFTSLDFIMSSNKYFEMYKKHKNSSLASIYGRSISTWPCLEVTKHAPFYQDFIARSEISVQQTPSKTELSKKKPVKNTQQKAKKDEFPALPSTKPIVNPSASDPLTEKKQTSKKSKK